MRLRLTSWLVPLGCVSVTLGVIAACDSDPDASGGGAFDASIPSFDGSSPPGNDGSAPDADADAGPLPVTVRVVSRANQPIGGATVVFGGGAGDVIQAVTTDATGAASLVVPSGSQVTVALGTKAAPRLVTITSVEPGDDLLAVDVERRSDGSSLPSVGVLAEPDAGLNVYFTYRTGECMTGGSAPTTYVVSPRCFGRTAKVPVVVDANDANNRIVGFQFAKGVSLPDGGGVITPTLSPWSTATTTQTILAANPHDGGGWNRVSYGEIADGVLTANDLLFDVPNDGGNAAEAVFSGRTGFADAVQTEVGYRKSTGSGGVVIVGNAVRAAAPTGDTTSTIDFATRLPEITSASLTATAPARPVVTWTPAASLASADATYVVLRWFEDDLDGGTTDGTWTIVAPPGLTSVQAPALPASVLLSPGATATYATPATIVTVDASFASGYADARKAGAALLPSDMLVEDNGRHWAPPLPVNGTVRFTAFTQAGD